VNTTLSCPGGAPQSGPGPAGLLRRFREELYGCLERRGDALFALCDAVLCGPGRVTDLARLSLVPELGRGHGAVYDALGTGRVEAGRLRRTLAGLPLPAWPDGGVRLAVDVSAWPRPGAVTSPGRVFCHLRGRGKDAQVAPGWPYSVAAALGPGASSWAVLLDAVRLGPGDDECAVTAAQLREVVGRLVAAGHWRPGAPPVIITMDARYSPVRLAWLLRDLPVTLVARVRSTRVFYAPPPARPPGARGRPPLHGAPLRCAEPGTWGTPDTAAQSPGPARHGPLAVMAWARRHQAIHRACGSWEDWPPMTEFPVIEGTLIRIAPQRPGREGSRGAGPTWLWASDPGAGRDAAAVATLWQAYLRRFDIEHAFRFLKQQLGWARPLLRDPAAADRWTWLLIACHAQLWLARTLAADARLPWQRPQAAPGRPNAMTPSRVRAGFRHARAIVGTPAGAAKFTRPGPGRPKGSKNKHKAPRHPVTRATPRPYKARTTTATKEKQTG
jgi:hypothetical protein